MFLQPHELDLHLAVRVLVVDQEVFTVVVVGDGLSLQLFHGNRRAEDPEGLRELIQQSQTQDAAVLQKKSELVHI